MGWAAKLASVAVDELLHVRIVDIVLGHDGGAGTDQRRHRLAVDHGVGGHDAVIADLRRVLGDGKVDQAGLEVVDDPRRRVERDDPDGTRLAKRLDAVGGPGWRSGSPTGRPVSASHTRATLS